jgi:hypothetical protein
MDMPLWRWTHRVNSKLPGGRLNWPLFCAVTALEACTSSATGPKRIEADGDTYIACGGAVWVPSAKDTPADNTPTTYDVLFTDLQGTKHELKHARGLRVTNLQANAPECIPK